MDLTGELLIGGAAVAGGGERFQAIDAATGAALAPWVSAAAPADVARACRAADLAFASYSETSPSDRADFLEAIARETEQLGEALIVRAMAESGLPRPRLQGERARTTGQLRLFAEELRRGDMFGVRIDPARPDRKPAPRPDLRLRRVAVGPVAIFGASNFPLAFSVAGGDTASALAAGCPVVVKGHPAHAGTGELVGRAVVAAVKACGLDAGVFSLVTGATNRVGEALVGDPHIRAVGFTGSRAGGLALMRLATQRPEPIPVYAEMSSVNPVFLLPGALALGAERLGAGFVGSLVLGAGQFCTNPGLVFAVDGPDLERFIAAAAQALAASPAAVMLSPGLRAAYETGIERLGNHAGVRLSARGAAATEAGAAAGALFETTAATFNADATLAHEVFGAAALVVRCSDADALVAQVAALEGQLTATLHLADIDFDLARRLVGPLERKAGRILANGWPTGVEVGHAMVHGGPYPSTSDGRSTSVGSLAVERFLRPICYQDLPQALLPAAVRDANPFKLDRRLDGVLAHADA